MTKQALEIVEFKLNKGISEEDFLAAVKGSGSFISGLDGFIERQTAKKSDDCWIDVVCWRDMASAQSAATQFEKAPEVAAFMMMIDFETVKMQHLEVASSLSAT